MFTIDLQQAASLWILTFVFGIISLPISLRLFPNLLDKGYFVGKLLTLFVVAYCSFTLATLKILPLGLSSLLFLTIAWAGVNAVIWWRNRKMDLPWQTIVVEEILFLILGVFLIFIKGHQPEIYQIERFMDFGFIKALTQSNFLPLEDIWKSGQPLNYYYFGHFLAYVLLTLTRISIISGFFLVQCWVFAFSALLAFVAGGSFLKNWHQKPKWIVFAGSLSLFAVIFAGDWQTFSWLLESTRSSLLNLPPSNFWYPDPTRIIPGTISELPIYSFIVADLHAHVWGFLIGSAIICILISFWFKKNNHLASLLVLSLLLGLSIMANTWDFLTLGSIVALVLLFRLKRVLPIILVLIISVALALPWLLNFNFPLGGLGFVTKHSPIKEWVLFWGPSLFLIALYFFSKIKHKLNFEKEGLLAILLVSAVFWIVFMEFFYAKDILSGGEWFRANTYFKVSLQVLLWVGLITGPTIFLIVKNTSGFSRLLISLVLSLWLATRVAYPIKAIHQANLENKKYTGFSTGLDFWKSRFPKDFAAFEFLAKQPKGVVLEADGDSYQDTSFFSTFLGWPTVSGWAVHEWTWHGSYDDVGLRAGETREVYTGTNPKSAIEILKKYKVKYIIIGSQEKRKYQDLKSEKLLKLGRTIYNIETIIIQLF